MTDTTLPPHLEHIGRQLTAAAHDLSPAPRRPRRRAFGLAAVSSTGLAAIATATVLAVGATTDAPPAFAVTRHHDGSVSLKLNRATSLAEVNRKLAAMGIERISTRTVAASDDLSSLPYCSSIPSGWKGVWVQVPPSGSTASGTGTTFWTGASGTWHLVICKAVNPGYTGPGDTRNTGSGNTGAG
jgi:hypothetical protein